MPSPAFHQQNVELKPTERERASLFSNISRRGASTGAAEKKGGERERAKKRKHIKTSKIKRMKMMQGGKGQRLIFI